MQHSYYFANYQLSIVNCQLIRAFRLSLLVRLLIIAACLMPSDVLAQSKGEMLRQRADSMLEERYNRISYDTTFIIRPMQKWTLKTRVNVSGNLVKTYGKHQGVETKSHLETDRKATVSLAASYRGLSAGISFNPAHLGGRDKDVEYNLNYYGNRFSVDASYQRSKTLHGYFRMGDERLDLPRGDVNMTTVNIAGSYTFNHRRFSYPAAFTQSYLQRRSAGSWLAGFGYQSAIVKHAADTVTGIPQLRMYVGHFAIGGGYGYNLVAGKRWLFHLSALPTLIIYSRNNITVDGEKRKVSYHFPEMIFNHRLAIVYNISKQFFIASTTVINLMTFHSKNSFAIQNKWRSRLSFGVRF